MAARRKGRPNAAVIRAEAAAGGMRALARLLGVSPSTVHTWRTKGPSARGAELLKGVRGAEPVKLPRGAAGPVRKKAQQLLDFVKKFEKRSETAKKSWATRKKRVAKRSLIEEWFDIHRGDEEKPGFSTNPKDKARVQNLRVHIQNQTPEFKRFMRMAKLLSFSTKEAKDFWFSPKAV